MCKRELLRGSRVAKAEHRNVPHRAGIPSQAESFSGESWGGHSAPCLLQRAPAADALKGA